MRAEKVHLSPRLTAADEQPHIHVDIHALLSRIKLLSYKGEGSITTPPVHLYISPTVSSGTSALSGPLSVFASPSRFPPPFHFPPFPLSPSPGGIFNKAQGRVSEGGEDVKTIPVWSRRPDQAASPPSLLLFCLLLLLSLRPGQDVITLLTSRGRS